MLSHLMGRTRRGPLASTARVTSGPHGSPTALAQRTGSAPAATISRSSPEPARELTRENRPARPRDCPVRTAGAGSTVASNADVDLQAERVYRLQDALTEAVRASEEGVQRFVESAHGTLRVALSRRPRLIFGRRGSGKTSLPRKAIAEHNVDRRPSAFVDLEPFKGHTYPDVLISVLIEFVRSLKLWLDEAAVAPANRERWFSRPRKGPLARSSAKAISDEIGAVLADLEVLLSMQDEAEIERRSQMSTKEAVEIKASASAPGAGSVSAGMSAEEGRTDEMLERLPRSEANYLYRKILESQCLLKRVVDLANADGLLILDDLCYTRPSDRPLVVDYFRLTAALHSLPALLALGIAPGDLEDLASAPDAGVDAFTSHRRPPCRSSPRR
jgi:hypothetical protein